MVLPWWVVVIITLGSVVDLAQFVWLVRRGFRKLKRGMYNRVRREVLEGMPGGKKDANL